MTSNYSKITTINLMGVSIDDEADFRNTRDSTSIDVAYDSSTYYTSSEIKMMQKTLKHIFGEFPVMQDDSTRYEGLYKSTDKRTYSNIILWGTTDAKQCFTIKIEIRRKFGLITDRKLSINSSISNRTVESTKVGEFYDLACDLVLRDLNTTPATQVTSGQQVQAPTDLRFNGNKIDYDTFISKKNNWMDAHVSTDFIYNYNETYSLINVYATEESSRTYSYGEVRMLQKVAKKLGQMKKSYKFSSYNGSINTQGDYAQSTLYIYAHDILAVRYQTKRDNKDKLLETTDIIVVSNNETVAFNKLDEALNYITETY